MGPQAAKVAAARRRMGLSRLARLMGPILLIGAGASLLLVGLLKYAGHFVGAGDWHPLLWTLVALIPLIVGLSIGLVRARRSWPTSLEAASRLDEVSRTHDAIGTSMSLSERGQASGFEAIALREGEKASERADVRSVASIVLGWTWPAAAFLALGAGLMVWLAPVRTPSPERTPVVLRPAPPEAVQEASERLAQMKELVQESSPDPEMVREELAEIEALERELMEGTREPEETIAAATETLERAAQEAQSQAERERQTTESLQERLRRVESERYEAARHLAEELQESDFEGAAQEAERLLNELAQDPTQAERIAQELRDLADEIDPSSSEQNIPSQPNEPAQPSEPPSADELREQLEREGVPPEAAERLAEEQRRELEEQQEQDAAEREARERAEEIAEKLRETADQADPQQSEFESNQSEETQPGQDQEQPDESQSGESDEPTPEGNERDQGQEREPGQSGQDEPAQSGEGESEPRPEPGQPGQEQAPEQGQGEENAGDEGQPREGGEQPGDSPAPTQQPGSQEGQQEQGQGEQGQSEEGQRESAEDTQGEQGQGQQSQEGQGGEGDQPGQSPSGQPGQPGQPGEQPGVQPGQNPAQPGQQPGLQPGQQPTPGEGAAPQQGEQEGSESESGGTGSGTGSGDQKGLGDVLRENAQREQSAQEMQERANRLREESRRTTDPEGAFDPLTDAVPPSNPWDGDTQFVDARREPGERQPEDERTIAEWFTPGDMEGESPTRGRITPGETVRSAGERAERAIEQQNVPRRHAEMIKRVFDRLSREAESAGASASPVRDAEDAP